MKKRTKYKNKILNITNVNKKDKYKRRYMFLGVKLTIKNKKKYNFYKEQKKILNNKLYQERQKILNTLKPLRKNIKPVLTIILVTYNHGKTIKRALESILEQETKYPYIIRICDDASTDNTVKICMQYAQKYPEKIELILQPYNTDRQHVTAALRNISSPFWAALDGDDYWCCKDKIQLALDYMLSHPDCVMYVHDVLFKYKTADLSMMHDIHKIPKNIVNPYDFNNILHSHIVGRVYRNIIDFKKEFVTLKKRDGMQNELFLSKGKAYYEDKIMSVYDRTTGGVWNNYTKEQWMYASQYRMYVSNRTLKFKYDKYFLKDIKKKNLLKKVSFLGNNLAWRIHLFFTRLHQELKEFKRIHTIYNKIKKDLEDWTPAEMNEIKKIERRAYENISKN